MVAPAEAEKGATAGEAADLERADALFARRGEAVSKVREAIDAYERVQAGPRRAVAATREARALHYLGTYGGLEPSERQRVFVRGAAAARSAIGTDLEGMRVDEAEAWAWLAANLAEIPDASIDHPEWRRIAERLVKVSETAGQATGHRLLGRFLASRPIPAGGDIRGSQQHFERALAVSPDPLTAFEMARTWAVEAQDAAKFESLLRGIVDDGARNRSPEAAALREAAQRLLRRKPDLFGDPAVTRP